ncbi:hypothetical protein SLOPH_832 [Spraguea lophii 42_110]|uniref:Uncharacterized protein n=1 Tax=Spraguea lophii (strain 42_110) TaxID=1358809 RepID=S7XTT5_SPRLO|nr:hypothetical protein SLOPH_832 [Spraguea lophii 42_110]
MNWPIYFYLVGTLGGHIVQLPYCDLECQRKLQLKKYLPITYDNANEKPGTKYVIQKNINMDKNNVVQVKPKNYNNTEAPQMNKIKIPPSTIPVNSMMMPKNNNNNKKPTVEFVKPIHLTNTQYFGADSSYDTLKDEIGKIYDILQKKIKPDNVVLANLGRKSNTQPRPSSKNPIINQYTKFDNKSPSHHPYMYNSPYIPNFTPYSNPYFQNYYNAQPFSPYFSFNQQYPYMYYPSNDDNPKSKKSNLSKYINQSETDNIKSTPKPPNFSSIMKTITVSKTITEPANSTISCSRKVKMDSNIIPQGKSEDLKRNVEIIFNAIGNQLNSTSINGHTTYIYTPNIIFIPSTIDNTNNDKSIDISSHIPVFSIGTQPSKQKSPVLNEQIEPTLNVRLPEEDEPKDINKYIFKNIYSTEPEINNKVIDECFDIPFATPTSDVSDQKNKILKLLAKTFLQQKLADEISKNKYKGLNKTQVKKNQEIDFYDRFLKALNVEKNIKEDELNGLTEAIPSEFVDGKTSDNENIEYVYLSDIV